MFVSFRFGIAGIADSHWRNREVKSKIMVTMNLFVGVDLGGTNIKAGLVDIDTGKVIYSQSVPTLSREGPDAVMARMAGLVLDSVMASGYEKSQVNYWRVRAANVFGQYSLWQASSFRTAMPPPVLVYPGYLETPNNLRPVFDWEDVPGATGYGLVVSTHANFSSPVISVSVKNSYYQPTVDLPWNKVLFWRVRAKGANLGNWGSSNFASPHPPQKVSPFTPAAGAVVSRMPTLTWTKAYIAPGIEFGYYLLQVDDDSDFSSPLIEYIETNINQRTYKITETEALLPGSRYYWRIRAANSVGHFSTWKSRSFKTSGVRVTATPTPTPTATPPAPLTLLYENLPNGFSFYYPEDATLVFDGGANFARIRLTYAPGTNLHDKNLEVSAWDASQPCESPVPGIETARRTEIINGLSFLVQEGEDHGLGNIYNWVGYSTLQGNVCANLLFVLHSTAPGNYYPTPPPLFDKEAESVVFGQIVNTFAWLPSTPTPTPTATLVSDTGPYAVILANRDMGLDIHAEAGENSQVVGNLPFDARDVMSTGAEMTVDMATWREIYKADGGAGWVNAYYLTEQVSAQAFAADSMPGVLINTLKESFNNANGYQFGGMLHDPHGVDIWYTRHNTPVHYTTDQSYNIFDDQTVIDWGPGPGGGTDLVGTFSDAIRPKVLDVLNGSYELYANDPGKLGGLVDPWPYTNLNYYTVYRPGTPGVDLDWRAWLVGFEYINGHPYIVAMIHFQWEP